METKFIDAVEKGDVLAFQGHFAERIGAKVETALDACKIEVAKNFFTPATEEQTEE